MRGEFQESEGEEIKTGVCYFIMDECFFGISFPLRTGRVERIIWMSGTTNYNGNE